jgi:hypothetical protein
MSQSYSSNCFSTANVIQDDMQNIENNFDALRSLFSGSTAPTSPDAGQLWYDTTAYVVKIRYNSSWVNVWDMANQRVASGQVKTDSLAASILSTDSTGRAKMAPGYITSSHVDSIDVTKIANLNKAVNLGYYAAPTTMFAAATQSTVSLCRTYLPNNGAGKLKCSLRHGTGSPVYVTLVVGTSAVSMGYCSGSTFADPATYIDVTAWLGTLVTVTVRATLEGVVAGGSLAGAMIYLTT